jgi:hypothetical protein
MHIMIPFFFYVGIIEEYEYNMGEGGHMSTKKGSSSRIFYWAGESSTDVCVDPAGLFSFVVKGVSKWWGGLFLSTFKSGAGGAQPVL